VQPRSKSTKEEMVEYFIAHVSQGDFISTQLANLFLIEGGISNCHRCLEPILLVLGCAAYYSPGLGAVWEKFGHVHRCLETIGGATDWD
jgi:hypothetical protein